jgi:hypothetical protein
LAKIEGYPDLLYAKCYQRTRTQSGKVNYVIFYDISPSNEGIKRLIMATNEKRHLYANERKKKA